MFVPLPYVFDWKQEDYLSVTMHETCGVNLKDVFFARKGNNFC